MSQNRVKTTFSGFCKSGAIESAQTVPQNGLPGTPCQETHALLSTLRGFWELCAECRPWLSHPTSLLGSQVPFQPALSSLSLSFSRLLKFVRKMHHH